MLLLASLICVSSAFGNGPALSGIAASADSAETASSNPAGMSRLDESQLVVRTLVAKGFGDFEVDETQTTISGGNPRNNSSPVLVPSLFYVHPLGDRWRVGMSVTVPSGFGADYGPHWAGRFYTDDYSLVYVAFTPAVSYRVDDHLSLGAAVSVNYTASTSEVAVNTLLPSLPDGRLRTELEGIGSSVNLSMLWEFDERTRFGLTYTSEAKANLEGDLDFRNVGPVLGAILEATRLNGANLKVENILPQRAIAGVYHAGESGWFATLDVLWMDFSKFATGSVSLNGTDLDVADDGGFQDFGGATVGFGFPHEGRIYSVGAFYTTSPVDDSKRTLALALDRMWGVGAGVTVERSNQHKIDVFLNVINYGDSPVDTGPSLIRGRVVGENVDPYALVLDMTYRF